MQQSTLQRVLDVGVRIGVRRIIGMWPIILRQRVELSALLEQLLRAQRLLDLVLICQFVIGAIV